MLFLSAEAAFRHDYCPGRLGEDLHPVHELADERQSLAACRIARWRAPAAAVADP